MGMVLHLLGKALVSRVNRRIPIRTVKFDRSTYEVEMWSEPGFPHWRIFSAPIQMGGL